MASTSDADPWTGLNFDDPELQNLLDKPLDNVDNSRLCEGEQHQGFDRNVGESWIYPSNLPCRSYQMSIVQAALYRNTLVCLPTGLGKTFIAAVVMYNIFRWYPRGKVIFMAPTRPLVNQQIEACQKIMPFPKKYTVELTGKLQRAKRAELWKTKRVFFATPQVVQSDIMGSHAAGNGEEDETSFDDSTSANKFEFPFDSIKLIVIDEAHKAKGKYAYTEVAQAIAAKTKYFRVVALSATPGRTMEDVAEVCRNLLISHVEVRWDSSLDVMPYVHKRSMETVVVSLGERIKEIREELLEIIDPYLRQLIECEMLSGSLSNINRNFLLYEQKRYQERSIHNGRHPQHSAISSNFSICISLYHSLELLERHGLRVFLNNFEEDEDGKGKFVIQMDRRLRQLVDSLKEEVGPNPFNVSAGPMTNGQIAAMPQDLDFGHPKFEKARECLLNHFKNHEESRAIVFCEYRESVLLIYRMLLQHVPTLRPRCFVGQGGTGALRALTQKQQMQIMNDFRSGKSNILIATSIGEEGIDVGEVDLIVCFDISTSNPTRFVQRIGRTGRKKNGNVVMLVTEGREQQILREVLSNKDQTNKKILRSSVVQNALYKHAPRLVPTEFKPQCVQTFITPHEDEGDDEEDGNLKKAAATKKATLKGKAPEKGVQDLRKFFNKKPAPELDAEDLEYFEIDTKMTQAKPGIHTQQTMEKSFDKMKNLFKDLQSPQPAKTAKNAKQRPPKDVPKISIIEAIDLCDESPEKIADVSPKKRQKLSTQSSQGSIKSYLKDMHETSALSGEEIPNKDSHIYEKLKELMETTFTTREVLKRAAINDLSYHLKSEEMSDDMKFVLLTGHVDFVKENLEQMKVLNALQDFGDDETPEEKSIKEVHKIIVKLFGGLEKVEKYLQDVEMDKFKEESTGNDFSSDDEDSEDEEKFKQTLDKVFGDLGEPLKSCETFDWVQEKYKQTERYKEAEKAKQQREQQLAVAATTIQESMVYNTFVDADEEEEDQTLNNCDEVSFTESKYSSQWLEFNKPNLAFKSTPLQAAAAPSKVLNLRGEVTKKFSLLTKLEEANEEDSALDKKDEGGNSKFLDSLLMCEKELNTLLLERKREEDEKPTRSDNIMTVADEDSSSRDTDVTTGSLVMLESEFALGLKAETKELAEVPEVLSSTLRKPNENSFTDHMEDDEEDEMFLAALEAEMRFTQTKEEEKKSTSCLQDSNKTPDIDLDKHNSSSVKLTPPSLNSTPDNLEFKIPPEQQHEKPKTTSSLPTPPEISIQHELDVDMEAFMEPFPEEQELIKNSRNSLLALTARRESLKENFTKEALARQSPDLFAEDQSKSPNLLHEKAAAKTSLASKLSAKLGIQKCQSNLNPITTSAATFKSPPKNLFSSKSSVHLTSPSARLPTDKQKNEKSPSLFDMYLKNGKGRVKLPSSLRNTSSCLGISTLDHNTSKHSPAISATQEESIMVVRKRANAPKRKIFDSDSESQGSENDVTVLAAGGNNVDDDDDSDFEQVAATQALWCSKIDQHPSFRAL